ncbi:MAG: hypothetical protein R3F17_07465 [Planctomycetota bacterium]
MSERRYAQAVRLEVAQDCPDHVAHYLLKQFDLESRDLYRVNGPSTAPVGAWCARPGRADLKYSPFAPLPSRRMRPGTNIFDAIRNNDVLLHLPPLT